MHNENFCNQTVGQIHGSNLFIKLCVTVGYCLPVWKYYHWVALSWILRITVFPYYWRQYRIVIENIFFFLFNYEFFPEIINLFLDILYWENMAFFRVRPLTLLSVHLLLKLLLQKNLFLRKTATLDFFQHTLW